MTHRFPIKEIARQSGLGPATVDRVLNGRPNVSPQTRRRVQAALAELETQEAQLAARGRRLFVDVVVEAPQRFSRQVQKSCEAALPFVAQAVFRPRFALHAQMHEADMVALLERIKKRGSHGVILKARDLPQICEAVDILEQAGIPVVTLVTDIPKSRRQAYVGIDNQRAGKIAAYLLAKMIHHPAPMILTTRSQDDFQGEAARHAQFCQSINALMPQTQIVELTGGGGMDGDTARALTHLLRRHGLPDAVYSMGGGNKAILSQLSAANRPVPFIAHDLDSDNRGLLEGQQIDYVLHHDLQTDMRQAFAAISAHHGLTNPPGSLLYSDVQIVTPFNLPSV